MPGISASARVFLSIDDLDTPYRYANIQLPVYLCYVRLPVYHD